MKKTKFLLLLSTLTTKELKSFEGYLKGLNPDQTYWLEVFDYIKGYAEQWQSEELDKAYVLEHVFKGTGYNRKKLSNYLSGLNKVLEEFLRWQKIKNGKKTFDIKKMMIAIYKERNRDELFFKSIDKANDFVLEETPDMWTPLKLLQLRHEVLFTNKTNKQKIEAEPILAELMEQVDRFFINAKLRYSWEIYNRKNVHNPVAIPNWLLEYLQSAQIQKIESNQLSNNYLQILRFIQINDRANYLVVKDLLLNEEETICKRDKLIILQSLLNFCIKEIRKPDLSYKDDYFNLFIHGLDTGILLVDGAISSTLFLNIITLSCHLKKLDWANHFIETYSNLLSKKEYTSTLQLSQAIICFEERQFDKVLDLIRELKLLDVVFVLNARTLLIKSLVELQEDRRIINAECKSFEQYLRRDAKLNSTTIIAFQNFLKVVKMLYIHKSVNTQNVQAFLNSNPPIVYLSWLQAKLNDLLSKNKE